MSVLNRTNIASITFQDGSGVHIRIYYQDNEGNIRETFYDQGHGWALRDKDIIGVGRLNTGIAAVTWNNGTQIRVYFFNRENQLVERCYEGGAAGSWVNGYLTDRQFPASALSSITATGGFKNGPKLYVFYQGNDGHLYEATNTKQTNAKPWAANKIELGSLTFPLGSSLAGSILWDEQRFRIYTTNSQNELTELNGNVAGEWHRGATLFTPPGTSHPTGAGIACAVWTTGTSDDGTRISVFSVLADNTVVCNRYTNKTKWLDPFVISSGITFSAVSGFKRLTDTKINIYFQSEGQHITEYTSNAENIDFVPNFRDLPLRR